MAFPNGILWARVDPDVPEHERRLNPEAYTKRCGNPAPIAGGNLGEWRRISDETGPTVGEMVLKCVTYGEHNGGTYHVGSDRDPLVLPSDDDVAWREMNAECIEQERTEPLCPTTRIDWTDPDTGLACINNAIEDAVGATQNVRHAFRNRLAASYDGKDGTQAVTCVADEDAETGARWEPDGAGTCAADCGGPLSPWVAEEDEPGAACALACDAEAPDGSGVLFASQSEDPDAVCYLAPCGSAERPFQYTDPEGQCFNCGFQDGQTAYHFDESDRDCQACQSSITEAARAALGMTPEAWATTCTPQCPALPAGLGWHAAGERGPDAPRCESTAPIPEAAPGTTGTLNDNEGETRGVLELECVAADADTPGAFHGEAGNGARWRETGATCAPREPDCSSELGRGDWTDEYQEEQYGTLWTRTAECYADNGLGRVIPFFGFTQWLAPYPDGDHGDRHTLYDSEGEHQGEAEYECRDGGWRAVDDACGPDGIVKPPRPQAEPCTATTMENVEWGINDVRCTPDGGAHVGLPEAAPDAQVSAVDSIGPNTGFIRWQCADYGTRQAWAWVESRCSAGSGMPGGMCGPGETPVEMVSDDCRENYGVECAPRWECR